MYVFDEALERGTFFRIGYPGRAEVAWRKDDDPEDDGGALGLETPVIVVAEDFPSLDSRTAFCVLPPK